jgi:hypothetical protein
MEINDVYGLTWQEKLDNLSACKCCERHQFMKPTLFKTWIDPPFNCNHKDYNCNCKCRHLARFICRQTIDYNGVGNHLEKPRTPTSVIR